ncbi:MAG: class I SAM-dependent rRNA methyltransferase [Planctomycetota bacterium]
MSTDVVVEPDVGQTVPPPPARVVLKKGRARPFHFRHPWVFDGAIARVEAGQGAGPPAAGDEAVLVDDGGKPIARGLFNPDSHLRLRLYSWDADRPLDERFWRERLIAARDLRRGSGGSGEGPQAERLVFGEADGLSGLVVDRFGDYLVVQINAKAIAAKLDTLVGLLKELFAPAGILLRTEKGTREVEGLELTDAVLDGDPPPRPMFLESGGVTFGVDLLEGQKTGFYLDQRDNRLAAAAYCADAEVLDAFCYSGGFGLTAAKVGGAKHVTAVDVSDAAVTLARANAELNGVADRLTFEKADAFDALERFAREGRTFDVVVLDPPKMTRHRRGIEKALKGYFGLNRLAVDVLRPGGLLVTCSCSGLITRDDFEQQLAAVAARSGRDIRILERRGPTPDHPVVPGIPETDYLKCCLCRVGGQAGR